MNNQTISVLYSAPVPVSPSNCPILSPIDNTNNPRGVCPVKHDAPIPHTPSTSERIRAALCKGGFASIMTTMVTGVIWHPVITVMVRQQFAGAVEQATQYSGVRDAFRGIYHEGARAFYRGLVPRLLQSPLAAIQWTTYEMFRDVVSHRNNSTFDAVKYGGVFVGSRILVTTAKCPFEVVKERMQVQGSLQNIPKAKSSWEAAKMLVARDGYRGLFHGLNSNIVRDLPVSMLMMSGNDFYTHLLTSGSPLGFWSDYFRNDRKMRAKGENRAAHIDMAAGALSGLTATVLTQPIDVAKTIIQTQSIARLLPEHTEPKYKGLWDVLKKTKQEKGIKFWFTGMSTRGAHIILGGSVYLMIYRRLQKFLTYGLNPPAKV